MATRVIFRPLFVVALFLILAASTNLIRMLRAEYISSYTDTGHRKMYDVHRLRTSRGTINLDRDTTVRGSIAFINGRQVITCRSVFYGTECPGCIDLALTCHEENMSVVSVMMMETLLGASKFTALLIFVYLSVLYCYRDLAQKRVQNWSEVVNCTMRLAEKHGVAENKNEFGVDVNALLKEAAKAQHETV